jgi:hypothetical protein
LAPTRALMNSCQSSSADASSLSPQTSTPPSAVNQDFSLSASSQTIQSSLKRFNDYVQKHYDRFVEHESLKRSRLVASFAEKEQSYERQISTLNTIHTDIAGLLAREKSNNAQLHQILDIATDSMARLCKVVADANFVFFNSKRDPHGIKQEDGGQENVPDITLRHNATISSLLSQIETILVEMNAQKGVSLPLPPDSSPYHFVIKALGKVADTLLTTQRSLALLLEDFKSVDAARINTECQNESLQKEIVLLQEELRRTRGDNQRISQELAAGTPRSAVLFKILTSFSSPARER